MNFTNKVVIVTGAASGIGATAAEMFAREGVKVALVNIDVIRIHDVTERNTKNGLEVTEIIANIADDKDVEKVIKIVKQKYGKIDILFKCAGIVKFGSVLCENFMKSYDDLVDVHLRAVMKLTSLVAPYLIETRGNIVNVASAAVTRISCREMSAYASLKAAVVHFTHASALDLAEYGVRVNCVSPGSTRTNILEKGEEDTRWKKWATKTLFNRIAENKEIADFVLYLTSDKAVGITGCDFINDSGIQLKC